MTVNVGLKQWVGMGLLLGGLFLVGLGAPRAVAQSQTGGSLSARTSQDATIGWANSNTVLTIGKRPNGSANEPWGPNGISSRVVMDFNLPDLAALPSGAVITSISLHARQSAGDIYPEACPAETEPDWNKGNPILPVTVHRLTQQNWAQQYVNWTRYNRTLLGSSNWATPGGDFEASSSVKLERVCTTKVAGNGVYIHEYDAVKADIQDLVLDAYNNRGGKLSLLLKQDQESATSPWFDLVSDASNRGGYSYPQPTVVINYTVRGTISGYKFHDFNRSGVRDAGEPGLPGFSIGLYSLAQPDGQPIQTTTTDSNGFYAFNGLGLNAPSYRVDELPNEQLKDGWLQTTEDTFASATARPARDIGNAPQVLKFCVQRADTQSPIIGATLLSTYGSYIRGNPPNADTPKLVTGADGCSVPTYLDYVYLKAEKSQNRSEFALRAEHADYEAKNHVWTFRNDHEQIEYIRLASAGGPPTQKPQVTTNKLISDTVLSGDERETTVELAVAIAGSSIKNMTVTESLASGITFSTQPSPVRARYTDLVGATTSVELDSAPTAGSTTWTFRPQDASRQFGPGTVSVSLVVAYTGPSREAMPVDVVTDNCSTSARVEYVAVSDNSAGCQVFPAGALTRQNARLKILGDAFLQDRSNTLVFDGDTLEVGSNTLIVSGSSIRAQATGTIAVPNYDLPTTGKLRWSALWNKLTERMDRAATTSAKVWPCPAGEINGALYLNSDGATPLVPPSRDNTAKQTWILDASAKRGTGCAVTLGNVRLIGTGTLVNRGSGASLTVRGRASSQSNGSGVGTLGYITDKNIDILDQAEPNNIAFVSNGKISLAKRDEALSPAPRSYRANFVAQSLSFPTRFALRNDITISAAGDLKVSVPPLLEEFTLPGSKFLQ